MYELCYNLCKNKHIIYDTYESHVSRWRYKLYDQIEGNQENSEMNVVDETELHSVENEQEQEDKSEISQPQKEKNRAVKEIISWIKVICIGVVLALLLNKFILFNFRVPTESMENTILVGNRIMSLRCAYWFADPERGDIIVFPCPDEPEETYIKRIVGMPGEVIEGKDGYVYVDGKKLEESYVTSELDEPFGPYAIPKDCYFVLGDNRDVSADARYWENKYVKREDIISKAVLRFYPNIKLLK